MQATDADCNEIYQDEVLRILSGTVEVSQIDSKLIVGTFSFVTEAGDSLEGSFEAPICDAVSRELALDDSAGADPDDTPDMPACLPKPK